MDNHFRSSLMNEISIIIFVLCLYLVQLQTSDVWDAVFKDLALIENTTMDVSLYTADVSFPNCNAAAIKCFVDELKVIMYESELENNKKIYDCAYRIVRNIQSLEGRWIKETPHCRKCETFQEKKYTEFMKNFKVVVQQWYRNHASARRGLV